MESLFLEHSRRQSFWSQWDITERAMAKHCFFKCIHVSAVYDNFVIVIQLTLCSNESNFLLLSSRIGHRHYTVIFGVHL